MGKILFTALSKLPLSLLYSFSTLLYILIYHIVKYRKKIVLHNLSIAFPEKTLIERKHIAKAFYKNFTDFMVELLKSFSMTKEDFSNRIQICNLEALEQCKQENKDVIVLSGHLFNWEWLSGTVFSLPQENKYAVYKKVANNFFDQEVHEARAKFNVTPLSVNEIGRTMMKTPNDGSNLFLFVADQSPFVSRIHYELKFFNRMTPVFNGYDKIARKKDYSIIYANMEKTSRGKYKVSFKRILPDKDKFEEDEIVKKFYQELTTNIQTQPAIWLWSHKRWKYTSGKDYKV